MMNGTKTGFQLWMDGSFQSPAPVQQLCAFGSTPFTVVTLCTLISGLVGNIFIIKFSLRQFKLHPTIYTVFLVNLSINNVLGLVISLPCFYIEFCTNLLKELPFQFANLLCFVKSFSHFNFLGVGMHTLAAMCYDRYEALAKALPLERMFTVTRAKKLVVVIWIVIGTMTFSAHAGHILTMRKSGGLCFSMQAPPYNLSFLDESRLSGYFLIVTTTIWMTLCNTIYIQTLKRVHQRIRHHIEEVSNVLGTRRVQIEINLYKVSLITTVMYSALWIPFGVSRGLFSSMKFRVYSVACLYCVSYQLSYVVFGILPYIYIFSDKTARKTFRGMFKKQNQINVMSISSQDTRS